MNTLSGRNVLIQVIKKILYIKNCDLIYSKKLFDLVSKQIITHYIFFSNVEVVALTAKI